MEFKNGEGSNTVVSSVRLLCGRTFQDGRVEVLVNDTWGSVCVTIISMQQRPGLYVKCWDYHMGVLRFHKGTKVLFKIDLAFSFGELNKQSFKLMDEKLKVVNGHTSPLMNQLGDHRWDSLVRCMMQNTIFEPMEGSSIYRSDRIRKGGTNAFKVDGSPNNAIVREVNTWFVRLVQDSDILYETQIDIVSLGKMVAETGARIDSIGNFFARNTHDEQTVMDFGVLRYPDIEHPFFKLYKIRLRAWRDSKRIIFIQSTKQQRCFYHIRL